MNVLLINIDSKIPNLALKKIEQFHLEQGDNVVWDMPLFAHKSERIYVSCIFKENRAKAAAWEVYSQAHIGGSGYDLSIKLPSEIEVMKPRLNMGFTTRGCIRNCGFCIVPKKEGSIKITGDLYDLWDGKSKKITLMDNNILAVPDHFFKICDQAREMKVKLDFNQGLDHRLLTPAITHALANTPMTTYRFAYDSLRYRKTVNRAVSLLHAHGIKYAIWYVLVGYDTSLKEDVQRINHLRFLKQRAFVQRFKMNRIYIPLARWANNRLVSNMTLWDLMIHPGKAEYNKQFLQDYIDHVGMKTLTGPKV